jgi:hypothetical protein
MIDSTPTRAGAVYKPQWFSCYAPRDLCSQYLESLRTTSVFGQVRAAAQVQAACQAHNALCWGRARRRTRATRPAIRLARRAAPGPAAAPTGWRAQGQGQSSSP